MTIMFRMLVEEGRDRFRHLVLGVSGGMLRGGIELAPAGTDDGGILFTIRGDGTLRGSHAIAEEIARRKLRIAVIGIPKTIDNDISYVQLCRSGRRLTPRAGCGATFFQERVSPVIFKGGVYPTPPNEKIPLPM